MRILISVARQTHLARQTNFKSKAKHALDPKSEIISFPVIAPVGVSVKSDSFKLAAIFTQARAMTHKRVISAIRPPESECRAAGSYASNSAGDADNCGSFRTNACGAGDPCSKPRVV